MASDKTEFARTDEIKPKKFLIPEWLVIGVLLTLLIPAFNAWFDSLNPVTHEVTSVTSPDRKLKAISHSKWDGAFCYGTWVSLKSTQNIFPGDGDQIFVDDLNHGLANSCQVSTIWLDSGKLLITYDRQARVFVKRTSLDINTGFFERKHVTVLYDYFPGIMPASSSMTPRDISANYCQIVKMKFLAICSQLPPLTKPITIRFQIDKHGNITQLYHPGLASANQSTDEYLKKLVEKFTVVDAPPRELKCRVHMIGELADPFDHISFSQKDAKSDDDDYMTEVDKCMKWSWNPPKDATHREVRIIFSINRDGSLKDLKLLRSSGSPKMDQSALQAAKDASPLPAPYTSEPLDIDFTFVNRGSKRSRH
jgi:TonB family protein